MNTYKYFNIYTAKFVDENINRNILNDTSQLVHIYNKRFDKDFIKAFIKDTRHEIMNYNHHDDEIQIEKLSYLLELLKFLVHINTFYIAYV